MMMKLQWFHIKYLTIFILVLYVTESDTSLTQLHIAFRHGERAPTNTFPNDPYINYNWPGGWGQLTNRGKLQMYELGQLLKTDYSKFITTYWYKDVNISSSYSERCLMSGELFCAGMFPPLGPQIWNENLIWQPIPVNYLPRNQDTNIAMKAPCAKYDKIFKEIRKSPDIVAIEDKYKDLKDYLTKYTGMVVTNIEDIESIYNTLEIEQLQNFTLPNWVTESMMETMKELGARNLALYSETEYMKRVKGESMERISDKIDTAKLYLYAVHDLTLVHILRSLDLINTLKPDFGAVLIFELYSDGEVKIIYRNAWNDKPEILVTAKCENPCNLSDFKKSLENVLPIDYSKECELDSVI